MTFIDAEELGRMATEAQLAMPDALTIRRVTLTTNNAGGYLPGGTTDTSVYGRVSPISRARSISEGDQNDRAMPNLRWLVTLPTGTDIAAKDKVIYGARTLEVEGVAASLTYEITVNATCSEIV